MAQTRDRIIICERCFSIPQIIILSEKNIKLYCNNCNKTIIKDYSYFDKFLNKNIDDKLFHLENCNYNKEHQIKASIYCFNCSKYLCDECIKIHDLCVQVTKHINTSQKIKYQYFCQKHKEYPLDRYCTVCNEYLCANCNHNLFRRKTELKFVRNKDLNSSSHQEEHKEKIYQFEYDNYKYKKIIKKVKKI